MSTSVLPSTFDVEHFLAEYWQKKPLLIRGNGQFLDPLDPDELAGMACEEFIESRLVLSDAERTQWTLRNGPFAESTLRALPEENWSLLIQAADQWHEGARALLQGFDFIPRWRIDDLMISLASHGGGVGPHFDYYDVFLIQGLGKKRWRLGGRADSQSALLANTDLRLLAQFETQEDWVVEPGDILYIPPNIAHYGIAIGTSITYSVGFRAPSLAQLVDDLSSDFMQSMREDDRYVDTSPKRPQRIGEIDTQVSAQLIQILEERLLRETRITHSFGRFMTQPKYPELIEPPPPLSRAQLENLLMEGTILVRHPSARFAFSQDGSGRTTLFADGLALDCPARFEASLESLCDPFAQEPEWATLFEVDKDCARLILDLYNQGSLWIEENEEEDELE